MAEKTGLNSVGNMAVVAMVAAWTAVSAPAVSFAQVPNNGSATTAASQQKSFDIPAGRLPEALEAYKKATGVTVAVKVGNTAGEDFQTSAVTGVYTNEAALRAMLNGTGLSSRFTAGGTAVVSIENAESVDVSAPLPNEVAMTKFTSPLLDTAASVTVIPQFVLKDEGVSTLRDALRNVPGISLAAGESGAQGDNLTIRGFTARNDIFMDGIRDFGSYFRDSFNYEQVEALEGPAGIAFGRGATGGVINQENKVPGVTPLINVQAQFGTNLTRRVTADINEPIPDVANGAAFRLNLMVNDSGVAGRPFDAIHRLGVAPSISFGLNTATRFTLSYIHLNENDTPDYGLPWFYNKLAPGVSRYAYFGFADQNFLKTNDDIITAKVDHDFNSHVTVHSIARAANYPRNAQITEPQICTNASIPAPVGGWVPSRPTSSVTGANCPYIPGAVNPSTILVNRNQIQIKSVEGDLWDQTEVNARFKVLGLKHEFVGGVEGGQEISNPIRYGYTISGLNTVPSTTLVNPNTSQVFGGTGYISSIVHTKAESVGLYFVDTVHLGRLFELSGGVRWDRFDTGYNGYQPTAPTGGTALAASSAGTFSRVDAQPSYRAAFVYKPTSHGSVYFDYGTSFNPSAESLALTSITQNVAPEQNETYEAGAKYSFLNEHLMMEGAWFRTEKDNARETDPNNSNNIVVAGNQAVKGVQVSAVGRLPQGMDIVAGYAYLSSKVLYSPFYPTSVGYQLANVPKQTFNAFITHRLPGHFNAGVGGNYVASRTASSTTPFVPLTFGAATTFAAGSAPCGTATTTTCYQVLSTGMKQVPGYWVFNLMLKRSISEHLEVQANVNNVLNRFFIDLPHPSHLIPGEGANALMGLNYKF
ncbi:TonB-dependent siderophore receptor [Granulicella tundricola]|uniref:TonB-dependent receptor n=1 Tax=Granulicella tundricola (strain ATCC BAA-1859 / DSM 23138 / MP5ACTX9) TaxID=1198114 RepID=E8WXQ7_GRATM|nr:TonB-dependent siderophore receptor [Granulicella tundricola]ADW69752.1 TonB-dependent receptor [Granulicella tundricola MP5ACTX9]